MVCSTGVSLPPLEVSKPSLAAHAGVLGLRFLSLIQIGGVAVCAGN